VHGRRAGKLVGSKALRMGRLQMECHGTRKRQTLAIGLIDKGHEHVILLLFLWNTQVT
jgi:hypothetical protein